MGNLLTRTMVKGEGIMPVPEGQITGSQIWTQPVEEEVVEEVIEETEVENPDDL